MSVGNVPEMWTWHWIEEGCKVRVFGSIKLQRRRPIPLDNQHKDRQVVVTQLAAYL